MTGKIIRHEFASADDLCKGLKARVEGILSEAIAARGKAFIALSGGNTPKALYRLLCDADIAWEKVFITLSDERWIDTQKNESNEHLIRHFLMQNKAAKANFIGLKTDRESLTEGIEACRQELEAIDDDFDLVILGMGEDGHTASLFPKAKELSQALSSGECCVAIIPPEAPYQRITLTLSRLLRANNIFLHIEGSKKAEVFEEALKEGSVEAMPIRAFIHREQKPYLEVFHA